MPPKQEASAPSGEKPKPFNVILPKENNKKSALSTMDQGEDSMETGT